MGGASAAADFKTELKENYRAWSDANLSGFVKEDMDDRVGGILGLGNLAGGLVDALVRLGLKPEDAVVGVMQFLSAKSKEYQQVIVNSYQRDPNGTLALTLAGPGFATLIAEHEGERIYQGAVQWSQKPTLDRTEEGVEVLGNAALLFAPFLGEARAGAVLGKAGNLAKASELGAEARAAGLAKTATNVLKSGAGLEEIATIGETTAETAKTVGLLSTKGVVTVYRVEGTTNTKILINSEGMARLNVKSKPLYLNFGSKERAIEFFQQKLAGNMPGARVKTFDVPESFLEEIKESAVPENLRGEFPNRPFIVDESKAADQFGLTRDQIAHLDQVVIQGSGKDITEDILNILKTKKL